MARPAYDYKVLNDNRSSYNLIQHEHHVPQSPLFKPGDNQRYGKNVSLYESSRPRQPNADLSPRSFGAAYNRIQHDQHVPQSPLYIPGQTPRQASDQNQGYGQGGPSRLMDESKDDYRQGNPDTNRDRERDRGDTLWKADTNTDGNDGFGDVIKGNARPSDYQGAINSSDPPTPNFNTSHLRFDNPPVGDLRLNLGDGETSKEHDISDFRGNPIPNPPPYKERADDGDVEYRLNSFSSRVNVPSARLRDPRVSGAYAGHAVQGGVRHGGALLFIRFPIGHGENTTVAAQAFQKAKIHDVGGRFLGIAKKVYDFGYSDAQAEALGVFHFPNMDKAVLFFQLDPILRQPDFPAPYGHAEMWIVCNAYLPDNLELFNTFLMSEIELHPGKDKRTFFEEFQVKFEKFLYKNGAMPFVVCSYGPHDRRSLRRHAYKPHTIVTAHLFQGLEHLKWLTGDESYCKFRSLHNQMALEKCSIFTLTKSMF